MLSPDATILELTRQRDALARVLLAVEPREHNRAVLASGADVLDYTHGMEALLEQMEAADRAHQAAFDPTADDIDAALAREVARRDAQAPVEVVRG